MQDSEQIFIVQKLLIIRIRNWNRSRAGTKTFLWYSSVQKHVNDKIEEFSFTLSSAFSPTHAPTEF